MLLIFYCLRCYLKFLHSTFYFLLNQQLFFHAVQHLYKLQCPFVPLKIGNVAYNIFIPLVKTSFYLHANFPSFNFTSQFYMSYSISKSLNDRLSVSDD